MDIKYVLGITNKLYSGNYNIFFEIDNIDIRDNKIYEKVMGIIPDYLGDYVIIKTHNGVHIIFLNEIQKHNETLGFLILKELFKKNGYDIDYIHDTEYKKLKEDFKVLRFSSKNRPNELSPYIYDIIKTKSGLLNNIVFDLGLYYKINPLYKHRIAEYLLNNKYITMAKEPNRLLIKYGTVK